MARGWESKSVESQTQDAAPRMPRSEADTAEKREKQRKKEGLELSRRRVLQEIATTRFAKRRTSLQQALKFLEDEIKKLDS